MDYNLVIELEKKLLEPSFRKKQDALELILSNDFIEIGSSGKIYNKEIVLTRLAAEPPLNIEAFDFNVIELSPIVIQLRFKTKSKHLDGSVSLALRSSIWKHIDDNWLMLFHQGTPTKNFT